MNSRKYWDEEAALRRMAALEDDAVFTTQEIINLYEEAVEDINGEIVKIRQNFLKRFGIDDKTAKFYLTNAQREENLEMLIRSLEYAPDDKARKAILDFIHRDGLSVRAYSARTERYNALRETIYARMKQLAVRETIILGKALEDTYKKSYYGAVDDIARAANVGINFSLLNDRAVKIATETKWSGKRFSERIWKNTDKLAEKAQDLVVRAIISGESHEKTARKLQEAFSVAEHNAATLVRTEKAHIMKEADFKAYEDIEIENYMYTALLDYVTCDICQSLDGMVFKTTEAKEGENCPVMHPRCRCTTVADIGPIRRRRAKYPDGKYEIVDGSLTYKEWYNGLPQDKKDAINTARKKNSRKIADTVQHERYKKVLGNKVPKGFDKFRDLKYNDSEKWNFIKLDYKRRMDLINHPEKALPNADSVTADKRKFTEYLFGGVHKEGLAKGRAFTSRLGYDIDNYEKLKKEILSNATKYPATYKSEIDYGKRYEQKMVLYGLNDKPANVVVGWLSENNSIKMTSAYIKELK